MLEHIQDTTNTNRRPPCSSASINMLSAEPPNTHDTNATDHDGQVNERTPNRLIDRGAYGSMSDGLRTEDGEHRHAELETLMVGEHSTTKTEALEAELKTLLEESQIDRIISRGPNNDIAGADMRIISRETSETQDMCSDGDNDDTQSNDRGVTNRYVFDSVMDHLAKTLD